MSAGIAAEKKGLINYGAINWDPRASVHARKLCEENDLLWPHAVSAAIHLSIADDMEMFRAFHDTLEKRRCSMLAVSRVIGADRIQTEVLRRDMNYYEELLDDIRWQLGWIMKNWHSYYQSVMIDEAMK